MDGSKLTTFGLRDSLFGHAKAASNGNLGISPKLISFDRSEDYHSVTFFTDLDLDKVREDKSKVKVAWLIESPEVHAEAYSKISQPELYKRFDLILTFHEELLGLDKRFIFTPAGGCWIRELDRKIHAKTKNLSIIASQKSDYIGQKLRHEIIDRFRGQIDGIFGHGYQELENKIEGLGEFRYSLVIENCRTDYYFTEKLIDCFVTGTVPIYWGCPSIGNFFDTSGIISFSDIDELPHIISSLSEEDYIRRSAGIQNNFKNSANYAVTEDYIYREVILRNRVFKKYL